MKTIRPQEAQRLLREGAVLADIREADEFGREHITGACHWPLSQLDDRAPAISKPGPILLYCKSGLRTQANAARIADKLPDGCSLYLVDGGLDAWRKAGLPVSKDTSRPLEIQRQVQIGAGALALAGTVLGFTASPLLFILPGFVGAGLLLAGITGFCGMARFLVLAPWNRRAACTGSDVTNPAVRATAS